MTDTSDYICDIENESFDTEENLIIHRYRKHTQDPTASQDSNNGANMVNQDGAWKSSKQYEAEL